MSEQGAAPAEGDEESPSSGPKGVVLIGALVGSLLIGGAAGVFAVGPLLAKQSGYVVATGSQGAEGGEGEGGASADGEHGEGGSGGAEGAAAVNLHLIDNLVLNPAGSGGSRFLMLAAAIELAQASHVEEMKARDSEVRDIVLRVLGARTVDELSEMSRRDAIKAELADSLSTLFKKSKTKPIRRVYFPQYVIQ